MEYIPEIVIGILSCIGTLIGSLAGIHKANELTNYRIKQLESKVNKHNNLIERTYNIEQQIAVLDNREKVTEHRLSDLESK
nr:MAG TPA: Hemolysin [Caudoviricetes sp.]